MKIARLILALICFPFILLLLIVGIIFYYLVMLPLVNLGLWPLSESVKRIGNEYTLRGKPRREFYKLAIKLDTYISKNVLDYSYPDTERNVTLANVHGQDALVEFEKYVTRIKTGISNIKIRDAVSNYAAQRMINVPEP